MQSSIPQLTNDEFNTMQQLLKARTGIRMQEGKKTLLTSRLGKRLRSHSLHTWRDYIHLLQNDQNELEFFINALTTNKTEFFREIEHFEYIEETLLKNPKKVVSVWVAASSYGQEAYSLAMTFEKLQKSIGPFDYRILATDIDTGVLEFAERGIYEKNLVQRDLSPELIKKHFLIGHGKNANFCRVSDDLKRNIKFRQHNLCRFDLKIPMTFDFIFVRNVLIYFDDPTIEKVIYKLQQHLTKDGSLISGMCESLQNIPHNLQNIGPSIYTKKKEQQSIKPESSPASAKVSTVSAQVHTSAHKKPKVLVVDDSKVIQNLMASIINKDPDLELFGVANDPLEAEELMKNSEPDLITLDMNMPHMTGTEYLEQMIPKRKLPVIMISGVNNEDRKLSLKAMELGALDFIEKPDMTALDAFIPLLIEKMKVAATAKRAHIRKSAPVQPISIKQTSLRKDKIVAIGSSTGGTVALAEILQRMPENIPPILIVQHIPAHFSNLFAKRLDSLCPFHVKEAEHMDDVKPGTVYIAPGDRHMVIKQHSQDFKIHLKEGEPEEPHIPAVDVLFDSVADVLGKNAIGVILTGMGRDGAQGLLKMKEKGALTIAQDEESSVVFGMPREAIKVGAAQEVVSLDQCPHRLCELLALTQNKTPLAS